MALYLNSAEPMCNGTDSTVLMCDDFERANWYTTDADHGGPGDPDNCGWSGDVFQTTPAVNVSGGCCGTATTATSGDRSGAKWQGLHEFGPSANQYAEIYHRFYTHFSVGYTFGHEKLVFYQKWNADSTNQVCCFMTPFGSSQFDIQTQVPDDNRYAQNQGVNLSFTPGHWYYVEVHIKLDTPMGNSTGMLEVWADDVGTNGLGDPGAGTG